MPKLVNVIRHTAYFFIIWGIAACGASLATARVEVQYPTKSTRTFDASSRVTTPGDKIHGVLGEKTRIPVEIKAPGITGIAARQIDLRNGDIRLPVPIDGSAVTCQIERDLAGASYVEIVPLRLGTIMVELSGRFSDGGFFVKRVWLEVGVPIRHAKDIDVGPKRIDVGRISLYMKDQPGRVYLTVDATYQGIPTVLSIAPRFAEFRVRSSDPTPAVEVDQKTGLLTPEHPGHAIVETSFGGLRALTCVVVHGAFSLNGADSDQSRCQELLSPGEQLNDAQ